MKTLVLWLMLAALPLEAQMAARIYEDKAGATAAVFPDAERAGSPLHSRMDEVLREMERKDRPLAEAGPKRIIVAVRAAAALQKERPEAAPNALEVTARSLGVVEKEYGNLSDPGSAFAKAFWEMAPEVRALLGEFESTGAWPLAAAAMAEFRVAGKAGTRGSADFELHQCWMAASGLTEWPPRQRPPNRAKIAITQTGADTWQSSDGATITRTNAGQYQVRK